VLFSCESLKKKETFSNKLRKNSLYVYIDMVKVKSRTFLKVKEFGPGSNRKLNHGQIQKDDKNGDVEESHKWDYIDSTAATKPTTCCCNCVKDDEG